MGVPSCDYAIKDPQNPILIMKSPYKSLVLLPGGSLRFRVPVNFEGFLKVSFEGSFRHLLCLGLRVYPNLGNYPFCFEGVGVRI